MEENISQVDLESSENDYVTQRTIEEVLDVETGEILFAEEFFKQEEAIIISARHVLELSIQSDIPKYKCIFCEQNVKISGRRIFERNKTIFFFAHFKDSDDCPIKTSLGLSIDEILKNKYDGQKESELHFTSKFFISDRLLFENSIQKGIKDVFVEKTFKNEEVSDNWRRPDVSANFNNISLVFELQLSTTFLSVIIGRESFYRKHKTFIIWVFAGLDERGDWQKLMEKDIYYSHKRNVFILDKEAIKLSNEKGELILHCLWQTPEIINEKVKITWHKKFIALDELTYDLETYETYYYNSDKDFYDIADPKQQAIIDEWEKAKQERWDKVKHRIEKRGLTKEQQEKHEKRLVIKDAELLAKIAKNEVVPTRFNKDGKWGYKVKNHVVVEPKYTSASAYKYGIAIVKDDDNKKHIINLSGKIIIDLGDVRIMDISLFNNTHLKLKIEEENSIQNGYVRYRRMKWITTKVQLEKVFDFNGTIIFDELKDFIDGKAKAKKNGKWGYIDETGTIQIDSVVSLDNNRNKIRKMGLWGLSLLDGTEITLCEYTEIENFIDNKLKAKKNEEWGYIDRNGKELIPFEFDEIQNFIDGKAIAKKNMKWGYIDERGKELIPFEFDEIQNFIDGKAIVKKNKKYGYMNEVGELIIPCIFFYKIINEVDKVKNIEGVEIYESKNGDIIIPSLEYLDNLKILALFRKIPIRAQVASKADFGIFLSFDNGEVNKGLLHINELRKVNLSSNDSQFSIGKIIDVYIQNVNAITKKISFTLRQVPSNHQPKKNKTIVSYYELKKLVGSVVAGKVTNIKEYGVFVEICEGVSGLVHISNLKHNGFGEKNIAKYFQKDKEISVAIISVDTEKKRIELRYIQ